MLVVVGEIFSMRLPNGSYLKVSLDLVLITQYRPARVNRTNANSDVLSFREPICIRFCRSGEKERPIAEAPFGVTINVIDIYNFGPWTTKSPRQPSRMGHRSFDESPSCTVSGK